MKVRRIEPGDAPAESTDDELEGAVLTRDLSVAGERWGKGRRLSRVDLDALWAGHRIVPEAGSWRSGITVLVLEPGDLHEDEAAARLAGAVAGPGLVTRGPNESRIDLVAAHAGVLLVRVAALERFNRLDQLEAFTAFDGQVVEAGRLVASVKVAPHVVPERLVVAGVRAAGRGLVRVAPFVPRRIGVLVTETVRLRDRARFEATIRDKVESLGSELTEVRYVRAEADAAAAGLDALLSGPARADLVLTAGAASTDPTDPVFVALERLGGELVRRGVPAHPGSMLWLGRVGRRTVLGLPTCGAYSRATAADLLLPLLLAGEPPSARTVARLAHGGLLTREMRFRFPAYARGLAAPEG